VVLKTLSRLFITLKNKVMKLFYFLIGMLFISNALSAQTSIYGKATDAETAEELIYANIELYKNDVFVVGATTDFEGNFSIPLDPGTYNLKITYTAYPEKLITGIIIKAGQTIKLDIQLEYGIQLCNFQVISSSHPLIYQDDTTSGRTITSEKTHNQPSKNINEIIQNTPGVSIIDF